MIQAKVKDTYRFGPSLQAFSRLEFIKGEWRDVPAEFEEQARAHEHLEIRDRPVIEPGAIETVAPVTIVDAPVIIESGATPSSEQLLERVMSESDDHAEAPAETPQEPQRSRGRGKRG